VPTLRELLQQVGKDRCLAGLMKKDYFCRDRVALYLDLINLPVPTGIRCIGQFGVEGQIGSFFCAT